VITGIAVSLELAVVLCVTFALMGGWAGRHYTLQRLLADSDPASWTERPSQRGPVLQLAARRSAVPEAPRAVLLGRISVMNPKADGYGPDTVKRIADVMRASLRRSDRLTMRGGETFTLEIDDADEGVAVGIAQRLRDALERLRFPHRLSNIRFSANFGVAAGSRGVAADVLIRRAREALNMALHDREEHIVKASDIDEIKLLPPPEPSSLALAA